MTESPVGANDALFAAEGVKEVRANASALQLTWGIRFGTVVNIDPLDDNVIMMTLDGSGVAVVPALSLIGKRPIGERCAVLSTPPSGLYIVAAVAAAGPQYQVQQILSSSASSITFSNIPTSLRRLEVSYRARGTAAINASEMTFQANGVGSASYFAEIVIANNAAISAASRNGTTSGIIGLLTGASAVAGIYGSGTISFASWNASSAVSLPYVFQAQSLGTGVGNFFAYSGGGVYLGAGPYTSLTFLPGIGVNFDSGTDFQLTGWV